MKRSIFTLFYPILFSIFILQFLVSCNDLRCIDGNNEMVSQIADSGKVVNQQNSNSRAYSPRGSFNSFSSRSMYMIY